MINNSLPWKDWIDLLQAITEMESRETMYTQLETNTKFGNFKENLRIFHESQKPWRGSINCIIERENHVLFFLWVIKETMLTHNYNRVWLMIQSQISCSGRQKQRGCLWKKNTLQTKASQAKIITWECHILSTEPTPQKSKLKP